MPDSLSTDLSVRLLRGGVAPKHVTRIVGELRDHYDDLRSEALCRGLSEAEAGQDAMKRLGSAENIVADALARPELKSWAARWPWAVYGLGPTFIFLATVTSVVLTLILFIAAGKTLTGARYIPPEWTHPVIDSVFLNFVFGLPVLLLLVSWREAIARHSKWHWPLAGFFTLCVVSAASDLSVTWPATPDGPASLNFGFSLAPPFPNPLKLGLHFAANITLLMSLVLFTRIRSKSRG